MLFKKINLISVLIFLSIFSISFASGAVLAWKDSYCADCELPWEETIHSDISVLAYFKSSVPRDSICISETRTCNNETLSGSYQYSDCCVPDCSCASTICTGLTCNDGCGGTCSGTKNCCVPDCSCVSSTCTGSTCSNGCDGTCPGTKNCCYYVKTISGTDFRSVTGINLDCGAGLYPRNPITSCDHNGCLYESIPFGSTGWRADCWITDSSYCSPEPFNTCYSINDNAAVTLSVECWTCPGNPTIVYATGECPSDMRLTLCAGECYDGVCCPDGGYP